MKNLIYILFALVLFSCKKENDFEDTRLNNPFASEEVNFVSIDKTEELSCDILKVFFTVNEAILPDTVNYTHVLFKNEKNIALKSAKEDSFSIVETNCQLPSTFKITLYNEDYEKESRPTIFTYNP